MNEVYKINDVISCEFLKIPKSMFANEEYKSLSSDAKLTFALLFDRLSLSKLNGWINERDEVYLIYTREEIAEDLGITYKKAIAAFRELIGAELVCETRRGRGFPNRIYIAKPKLSQKDAKDYVQKENKNCRNGISYREKIEQDMSNGNIKTCQNGISRTADIAHQDLPNQHTNHNKINKTELIKNDYSQSVSQFDKILENCRIDTFPEDEQKILYDALERMYYSERLRIGTAVYPNEKIRSRMCELDVTTLESAVAKLHQNDKPIKNYQGYLMSVIFNCLTDDYAQAAVDPFLNSVRKKE